MNAAKKFHLRSTLTFIKGVWQVVIFLGDATEHRSFLSEAEARDYQAARMGQLRGGKPKKQEDGASA